MAFGITLNCASKNPLLPLSPRPQLGLSVLKSFSRTIETPRRELVWDAVSERMKLPFMSESLDVLIPLITQTLLQITIPKTFSTVFDSPVGTVPSLTLEEYVTRVAIKTRATPEVLVIALALIDKLVVCGFCPTNDSIYRMIVGCFVIAIKVQDDKIYSNKYYSRVAGIPVTELNAIERFILNSLKFNVLLTVEEWNSYSEPCCLLLAFYHQQQKEQEQDQEQESPKTDVINHCMNNAITILHQLQQQVSAV